MPVLSNVSTGEPHGSGSIGSGENRSLPKAHGFSSPVKISLNARRKLFSSRVFSRDLLGVIGLAVSFSGGLSEAEAQTIAPLVPLTLDPNYSRGRNVSVAEQQDPAFSPRDYRLGSIIAQPSLGIVTGTSNNIYTSNSFRRSDAYYLLQPGIRIMSDFPRHLIDIAGSAEIQRYAHEKVRNQESYGVDARSRLDLGSSLEVTLQMQYARASESPFASDLATNISVLSVFKRFNPSVQVAYSSGRLRLTGKVEHVALSFSDIKFTDGTTRNQRERDRQIDRGTAQVEYAISPSIAVFGQGTLEQTDYKDALRSDGQPNRASKSASVLSGVNFDLAGLMRGSIGIGYTSRNYEARGYEDAHGLLLQVQSEIFVTPLTTLGIGALRTMQDSGSPFNGAYSDTRYSFNVDHALLRNLTVSAVATKVRQQLSDTHASSRLSVANIGVRYQSSRSIGLGGSIQYSHGTPGRVPLGVPFSEVRGQVYVRIRR